MCYIVLVNCLIDQLLVKSMLCVMYVVYCLLIYDFDFTCFCGDGVVNVYSLVIRCADILIVSCFCLF